MNEEGDAQGGAWLTPDEPDLGLVGYLRQHARLPLLVTAMIGAVLGIILFSRLFLERTAAPIDNVALTEGTPLLGLSPGLAYDPGHGQVVLFNQLGQTWLWSGNSWAEAHPARSPVGRIGPALAWDPKLKAILLFGGLVGQDGQPRDTWAWDGSSWRKLGDSRGAPPGGWAAMAYDVRHQAMVLLVAPGHPGGPLGTATTETWSWDGVHWKERSRADGSAPEGSRFTLAFDREDQLTLAVALRCGLGICTSETWSWDGFGWQQLRPPHEPDPSGFMQVLLDPASERMILLTQGNAPPAIPAPTQTWSWNGQDWINVGTTGKAGGIVYAVPFERGPRPVVLAFEDMTPAAGAPRVDSEWILSVQDN